MANLPNVWIVSLEWNQPPSEVTGDTGIVDVFFNEDDALKCQLATQWEHDERQMVYEFSQVAGRHCVSCGEIAVDEKGVEHTCKNELADHEDREEFCDYCGAECHANGGCDNDHDNWDIDVHCCEYDVQGEAVHSHLVRAVIAATFAYLDSIHATRMYVTITPEVLKTITETCLPLALASAAKDEVDRG